MTNNYKLLFKNIKHQIKGGSKAAAGGGGPVTLFQSPHGAISSSALSSSMSSPISASSSDYISNAFTSLLNSSELQSILPCNNHGDLLSLFGNQEFIMRLIHVLRFGFITDFVSFDVQSGTYPFLDKFSARCNEIIIELNKVITEDGNTLILVPGDSPYKVWFCICNRLKPHRALTFPLSGVRNNTPGDTTITSLDRFS